MRDIVHWSTFLALEISRRQVESRAGWAWCGPLEKDDEDAEAVYELPLISRAKRLPPSSSRVVSRPRGLQYPVHQCRWVVDFAPMLSSRAIFPMRLPLRCATAPSSPCARS